MKKVTKLYDNCWNRMNKEQIDEAVELLKIRFERNGIPLSMIKNKVILDDGCGSARYSVALMKLGAKKVYALDKGVGNKFKAKGIKYINGDVLNLPFKNNMFDFVFCNGVLHHTKNTYKGLKEIFRVLKKGGAVWLYLCGKSRFYKLLDTLRLKHNLKDAKTFAKLLEIYQFPPNKIFLLTDMFFTQHREYFTSKQLTNYFTEIGFNYKRLIRDCDWGFNERILNGDINSDIIKDADLRYLLLRK